LPDLECDGSDPWYFKEDLGEGLFAGMKNAEPFKAKKYDGRSINVYKRQNTQDSLKAQDILRGNPSKEQN
jgi:hypothetical protein